MNLWYIMDVRLDKEIAMVATDALSRLGIYYLIIRIISIFVYIKI